LTLLHDQPLVEHYFHPSGRRGLAAEAPAPAEPSGTPSPRARAIVLGAAATVSGLFALDSTVISVALPQIRDDLGGGSATIEWVSSVYLLTFAVTLLPAGRMVDRYGARRMFLSGVAVYVFAAVLGALAQAPWMLILGRGAQGVGAGIVGPAVLVLVTHAFGAERRGWAIGLLGMLLGVFSAAGPLVGGIFTDTVGWQAIFVVHATLAAVAAALVAHTIAPEAAGSPLPLRLASTAALAGVVLGIQVSIIEGPPLRVAGRRRLRRRRRRVRRRPLAARARADGPRPRFHDAANTHGGRVPGICGPCLQRAPRPREVRDGGRAMLWISGRGEPRSSRLRHRPRSRRQPPGFGFRSSVECVRRAA
jgi:hypothetical protein